MIPYPQGPHRLADEQSLARSVWAALPRAYAIVFYSTDVRFGWWMLVLALMVPWVGLAGLGGVVLAAVLAWVLQVDRGWIRSGFVLFNPLLAASAVVLAGRVGGWTPGVVVLLWFGAVVGALGLTVALQGWVASRLGVSAQSVPAVLVVVILSWCGMGSGGQGEAGGVEGWLGGGWEGMPGYLSGFFRAFAAMVFQSSEVAGILVYGAFVLSSPLGALMATVGYVAGVGALGVLGLPVDGVGTGWCGFNFLLAGVALGAGYQVPNRASLGLAVVGAVMTALVALGLAVVMGWLRMAPGALPYNLVVIPLVAALRLLPRPAGLVASPWTVLQPEGTARLVQINALRFPHYYHPGLFLPWVGVRVVTQGFDGVLTHRGWWRHALDFEVPGGAGSWDPGSGDLREFGVFESPVYAPVGGNVVAVENGVLDNAVGGNHPEANWGNHIILRADGGYHVMLAHFQCGSVAVAVGQRVKAGDYLGNVGNSGRSPVPHLHVHVQAGAVAGAPTMPFVLKHYIEAEAAGGRETYRLSGVPREGALIRPAVPAAGLYGCFSGWLPGVYGYEGNGGGDELRMDFDEAGRFRLVSVRGGGALTLYLHEGVLYAVPYEGGRGGILALLGVILARVPCMDEPTVGWEEVVAAAPFLGAGRRVLHNLLDPFMGAEVLRYRFRVAAEGEAWVVTAILDKNDGKGVPGAPRILHARVEGRHGVSVLSGVFGDGREFRYEQKKGEIIRANAGYP